MTAERPYVVAISGGMCSGKEELCQAITKHLCSRAPHFDEKSILILPMNLFYHRDLNDENQTKCVNFDHPSSFDRNLLVKTLKDLIQGCTVSLFHYDLKECKVKDPFTIDGSKIKLIVLKGLLSLYFPSVRDLVEFSIFLDLDVETRVIRRFKKDTTLLNRNIEYVIENYIRNVKPCFETFCLPTKKFATLVLPNGLLNDISLEIVVYQVADTILDRYSK